ncbi:hypothetical protein HMPREF9412_3043 [Paenibacillus sp. HGF5]|nr:hypothetical protein HMPREF9412_3043 [Paenibacillus sp. HGF5]
MNRFQKSEAVARKFSNGKLASKALTGAEFLPLSSLFQEIWRQQRLEERYGRAAGFQMWAAVPYGLSHILIP